VGRRGLRFDGSWITAFTKHCVHSLMMNLNSASLICLGLPLKMLHSFANDFEFVH
jgi:hypothetical protein